MDFLKQLDNNSILLVPNSLKKKILDYIDQNNLLVNVKLMTFLDLKKGLFFDYTNEAISFVMKKKNVNYGVSRDYLNNLYYIDENIKYSNDKLNFLSDLKKELDSNKLLIRDSLFINLLKSKKTIYVYGFDHISKFNQYLLDLASKWIMVNIIDKEEKNYRHDVIEFKTMENEVAYVFEQISKLIMNSVPTNKIYIANYSDEYYFTFKRLMRDYNLPIFIKAETSLYSSAIGAYFLDNLDANKDLLIYKIKKKFDYDENPYNAMVINKLVNLLNDYYWIDDIREIKDLVIEEMKNKKIGTNHFRDEITTTSIVDNCFFDDEYVFLIGFNLGIIPKNKRDEDYLSDDIKPDFLENTNEFNLMTKKTVTKAIKSIKNLTITYKLSSPFNSYSPSFLIASEFLNKIKSDDLISNYSVSYNQLILAKKIDNLIKFNEMDENLEILFNNYDINYKSYDNKFTGINSEHLREDINDKIVFSYTNISDYYSCPFKFYLGRILKIDKFETTLDQFIGSLFHFVLQNSLDDMMDIDEAYDKYIDEHKDDIESTNKVNYFLKVLRKEIHFVVDAIKEQYIHSSHTEVLTEKRIEVDVERKIKTKIKGFVDKILVMNNNLLVIDYKTNNKEVDRDLFEFGIGIQLPIYLYLLKCLDSNYQVAGMYLQHILDLNQDYDIKKDYLEEKRKKLKLKGITFNDIDLISKFDDTYDKSLVISSLSTKDGEIKKTKNILNLDDRSELMELMENLIYKAIDNVSDGIFDIKPIKIDKHADGCQYCNFKDVCYRKFKDYNYQTISKTEVMEDE